MDRKVWAFALVAVAATVRLEGRRIAERSPSPGWGLSGSLEGLSCRTRIVWGRG